GLNKIVQHLIFSAFWLYELRVFLVIFHQTICILAHFEKVRFFFYLFHFFTTFRAMSILNFIISKESLTRYAVPPFKLIQVNISFILYLLKNILMNYV